MTPERIKKIARKVFCGADVCDHDSLNCALDFSGQCPSFKDVVAALTTIHNAAVEESAEEAATACGGICGPGPKCEIASRIRALRIGGEADVE